MPPAAEPKGRVKDSEQNKVSVRPAARSGRAGPDIEVREDAADDDYEDEYDDHAGRGDDSIQIPTEGAPSWLVTMMIVSALACVVIAGYYLLH